MIITKKELEEMYINLGIEETKKKLGGICNARLYSLLKKAGIDKKRPNTTRHEIKLVD